MTDFKGKNIAVLGYGIEGRDVEKFLKSEEAEVTVLDKKSGENYLKSLDKFDVIVRSPGVYRYLPEIVSAEKSGTEITSAIKIFFENCPAKIIGVTGTKGKGTTATLIYEIFKKAGKDVYLAGNIGEPYLRLLPVLDGQSNVVLELSSFQLIDLTKSPHVAVVLNITQDHLDWHKDEKEYVEAKKRMVSYQKPTDFAVINGEYEIPKSFANGIKAKTIFFSKTVLDAKYKEGVTLRGEHNLENIAAAVTVAQIMKIKDEDIFSVLKSFKGLEHRLELVAVIDGILFYNDSFATGPQPTIAAIKSFSEPETVILGGSEKALDYQEFGKAISLQKNLECVILIGEIKDKIRQSLVSAGFAGKIVDLDSKPMTEIVKKAFEITPKGGVVILSPAAASFDMFKDYKERGKKFKEAVLSLK